MAPLNSLALLISLLAIISFGESVSLETKRTQHKLGFGGILKNTFKKVWNSRISSDAQSTSTGLIKDQHKAIETSSDTDITNDIFDYQDDLEGETGTDLVLELLNRHVATAEHPLQQDSPVFISFSPELERRIAIGSFASQISLFTVENHVSFDLPFNFQGFQIRFDMIDSYARPSFPAVSMNLHIVSEMLAKKVFRRLFETPPSALPSRKPKPLSWRRPGNPVLVLDYAEGKVFMQFKERELERVLLFKVTDIVRAYLKGWESDSTSFFNLPPAVAYAPCPLCNTIEAVDSYVRISKSFIKSLHTLRVKQRLGLGWKFHTIKNWLTASVKRWYSRADVRLSLKKQRLVAEWLRQPRQVFPIQTVGGSAKAEVFGHGIIYPAKRTLIIFDRDAYDRDAYHTYVFVEELPNEIIDFKFLQFLSFGFCCDGGKCSLDQPSLRRGATKTSLKVY